MHLTVHTSHFIGRYNTKIEDKSREQSQSARLQVTLETLGENFDLIRRVLYPSHPRLDERLW